MLLGTLFLLLALQENEAAEVKAGGKGVQMDYGPFLSSTVCRTKYKKESDVLSHKAITIRLAGNAAYCFDPDLLRAAGGWTGGFLDLAGTHLTSYKGSIPTTLAGALQFSTAPVPGWTAGDLKDTRRHPYGPLPGTRYNGLYLHGEQVVLAYDIDGCPVLDHPAREAGAFTRTIRAGTSKRPLTLLVCDDQPGLDVGVVGPGSLSRGNGRITVTLPPAEPSLLKIVIGAKTAAPPVDPSPLCKGGPPRWKETLVMQGALGKGDGPYLVDTLTIPEKNPWNSWLRLTALDFFSDGRAAVSTWNGDVWIVSGIDDALGKLEWRRFATGLYEPLGLRIVDDKVHVLARDQIVRLHDLNGDGEADFYECFFNGLITMANYHAFAFELHTDGQGNFYCAQVGHRIEPEIPEHGCVLKISKDGRSHEIFATGLRAPNGMSVGPNGEVTASDNQGNWMPASRVSWIRKGGFYGYVPHSGRAEPPKDYEKPLCWIPMAMDNSSGGQIWVTSDRWGPFTGHLLHTSYGTASLFHLPYEHIDGEVQGGVVKFPLTFASGIMRGRFHPKDGQLYVAGLRGWQTTGVRDGALQRVRYTGKPVHTIHSVKATRKGLELTFTNPVDPETAGSVDNWGVLRWNYAWTEKYGSPDFSLENPKKQGRDTVEVASAKVSADGKTVLLEIPSMRPVMQMLVKARIRAADGTPIALELYNTVNRLP